MRHKIPVLTDSLHSWVINFEFFAILSAVFIASSTSSFTGHILLTKPKLMKKQTFSTSVHMIFQYLHWKYPLQCSQLGMVLDQLSIKTHRVTWGKTFITFWRIAWSDEKISHSLISTRQFKTLDAKFFCSLTSVMLLHSYGQFRKLKLF